MSDTYRPEELDGYNFGDTTAPEGFNPDASGFIDPTPGSHVFEVRGWSDEKPAFELKPDQEWKWDGTSHRLNQLRVRFMIPSDQPESGAKTMDFIPVPTPGQAMPTGLANRWANFIKALGFDLPPGKHTPDGFKLSMIAGRRCRIEIEHARDANKQPKFRDNGKPQIQPSFFGYSRVDAAGTSPAPATKAARPAPNGKSSSAQPVAAATDPFDL